MHYTAKQIAAFIKGRIEGDENAVVDSFSSIVEGKQSSLSFLSNSKYISCLYEAKSSIVIINDDIILERPVSATLIRVPNAYESVVQLLKLYTAFIPKETGISEYAYVSPKARIGDNTIIYPFVYIGDNVEVGNDVIVYSNASIYPECKIGNRVIIHSGSVIGSDGFGYLKEDDGFIKIPHIGSVIIEDDVEIGANSCIDRGTVGSTTIHKGVKLDNLVHIAHNAEVGANTVMSAQVGVAGSTKIGEWCMFGGQVGLAGHITIGDRVLLGGQSGVSSSLQDNQHLIGTPPMEKIPFFKVHSLLKKLPDYITEINALKIKINELESFIQSAKYNR